MSQKNRIGVFGGSFDPPHIGHLICARVAAEILQLDKVLIIPTAVQPFKTEGAHADGELRWQMVCASVMNDPLFEPSRLELDRGGISYSVDTLEQLTGIYNSTENELFYMLGYDSFQGMENWKQPHKLFDLATVVALARPGHESINSTFIDKALVLDTPRLDISSRFVRARIARHLPVKYLVPAAVERIIEKFSLYL